MQDLLLASVYVIPAAFAALMLLDFVSGLIDIAKRPVLTKEDAAHILEIIDSVPELQPCVETCIESDIENSDELQYAYLPDPWMLAADEVEAIAPTAPAPTAAPCLRLLPPAKPQIITLEPVEAELLASFMPVPAATTKKKAGRPKKNSPLDAEFSANPVAKRKAGRPRKSA
jgi:hypothetical protein